MSTITNGTVVVERVLRPADFESKRASVSLSFAIEEGEDAEAVVERVGQMAHAQVMGMVRRPETLVGGAALRRPPKAAEAPVAAPTNATAIPEEPDLSGATPMVAEAKLVTDAVLKAAFHAARARGVDGSRIKALSLKYTGIVGALSYTLPLDGPERGLLLADVEALHAGQADAA